MSFSIHVLYFNTGCVADISPLTSSLPVPCNWTPIQLFESMSLFTNSLFVDQLLAEATHQPPFHAVMLFSSTYALELSWLNIMEKVGNIPVVNSRSPVICVVQPI